MNRLPVHSHFQSEVHASPEAVEEAARWLAANNGEIPKSEPTFREYTRELDVLQSVLDEIRRLRSEQAAIAARKKPKQITPTPRPKTAIDKADHKAALLQHKALTAQLIRG